MASRKTRLSFSIKLFAACSSLFFAWNGARLQSINLPIDFSTRFRSLVYLKGGLLLIFKNMYLIILKPCAMSLTCCWALNSKMFSRGPVKNVKFMYILSCYVHTGATVAIDIQRMSLVVTVTVLVRAFIGSSAVQPNLCVGLQARSRREHIFF